MKRSFIPACCLIFASIAVPSAIAGGGIPGAGSWEGKTSQATRSHNIQGHMGFAVKRGKIVYVQIFSRCELFTRGPIKIPIREGRFSFQSKAFSWRGQVGKKRASGGLRIKQAGCSHRLISWRAHLAYRD